MDIPFVDLKAHHTPIEAELNKAIQTVIAECSFIRGRHAAEFEKNFAQFVDARHCVGVGNGTDALYVALASLGIGPGDEVITAANSFIATSEAITRTGAKVVFVDCDENTYNIDVNRLEAAFTDRTKAVIPVHLYGRPADMEPINAIAKKNGAYVIEDAAQAHGARYCGKPVGTLADAACFSFFPGKNLGAFGDAGAVVTNSEALATRMRMLANHGRKDKYDHEFEGINSRLDGLQAAILNVKLRELNRWNNRRREVAARYDAGLAQFCTTPTRSPDTEDVYHLYVIRVKHRDAVRATLAERGITTGIHYPIPLPMLGAYAYLGHSAADFPVANRLKDEILSLPIHGEMTDEHVTYVIDQLCDVLKNGRTAQAA